MIWVLVGGAYVALLLSPVTSFLNGFLGGFLGGFGILGTLIVDGLAVYPLLYANEHYGKRAV